MKPGGIILLGLLAFIATLLLHAPAALLYGWSVGRTPSAAVVHGLQGTLAEGGFDAVTVNGRPAFGSARWTLRPLWLLVLRLTADVEAGGDAVVRGRVSRTPFGALRLSDVSAVGSVKALLAALGQPAMPVEGQARLDLPLVKLDHGEPVYAEGSAQIESFAWTLARDPLPLGSFTAELATDDKGINVKLGSGAGALELSGTATLAATHAYDVNLQMRARAPTAQLQALLQSLGAPDAQGWYHFRRNGTLP